jgi:lysophospholipase L1-like esterase
MGKSRILFIAGLLWTVISIPNPALAQTLRCGPFTAEPVAAPIPRGAGSAMRRFEQIKRWVKTRPYRVLFLGDSITERFDEQVWREHMAPRGVLNSGVNGDRTEHLLWRLHHGNLDGPPPAGVVVLIGTNDLTNGGHPRSPAEVAEGVRANLLYLRQRLPATRILLLGLYPRSASPEARLRRGTVAVNRLIRNCGDEQMVVYADIGGVLLDRDGRLRPDIAPDMLHFSRLGYERLVQHLDPLIDNLVGRR